MRGDFWRISWSLGIALVVGVVFGHAFVWLFISALSYVLWQQRELYRLYRWLQKPRKRFPPDVGGVMEGIVREVDFMRARHSERKRQLSRYLKRFQKATAALPDATVVLNESGEIEWGNEASQRLLGLKWPGDAGQRISNLIRHPDFIELIRLGNQGEDTIDLPSPVSPALYLNLRLIPYEQGQRLLVARDVTRLQRLERMRRDFIANISHELRTPLTVLRGYLEILEGKGADSTAWSHSYKTMQDQVTRMQHLVEDLLTLSRLENGEKKPLEASVAVPEMLEGICREARLLSGERYHQIQLKVEDNLWLRGDGRVLHSAFSNLVVNAIRYTSSGGNIRVHWFKRADRPCLEVIDSGEGIAPEHIPYLTERFYRVDKGRSREKGGTGLGLAIVKHALYLHGGYLEIESEVGKGSLFRCLFPPERGRVAQKPLSKTG